MSRNYAPDYSHTLVNALGIRFLADMPADTPASLTSAEAVAARQQVETVCATMPVDERTCQPFGLLSGGASLALAETVAGHGSLQRCPEGHVPCGIQVSANHVASAAKGDLVTAIGTLIHQGKTLHIWNVDIVNAKGKLISTARVTNQILPPREGSS